MAPELHVLLVLVSAHLVGDFVLQSKDHAARKHQIEVLLGHAVLLAALSYAALGDWARWQIPVAVFVCHGLTDFFKVRFGKPGSVAAFTIDQAAHLATLVAIAHWIPVLATDLYWVNAWGTHFLKAITGVSGLIVAVKVSGIVVGMFVEPFLDQLRTADHDLSTRGLKNGGQVIGMLERALIFVFVVAGHAAAIGFLIAAKSILRFGEVKDPQNRMEAEYIIIGTLLSFLLGSAASFGCRYLLGLVSS
jgi:uncharacterized protein DUF3307